MLWHSLALCIWQFPPSWTWIVLKSVLLPPGREQESFPDSWYYQHNSVRGNDGHTFFFLLLPRLHYDLAAVGAEKGPWNEEITTADTFKLSVGSVSNISLTTDIWPMSTPSSSKSNGFSEASSSTLDFFGVRASLAMSSSTDFRPCRRIGSNYSRKGGDPSVAF